MTRHTSLEHLEDVLHTSSGAFLLHCDQQHDREPKILAAFYKVIDRYFPVEWHYIGIHLYGKRSEDFRKTG
jgi:hypothetical protein